MDGGRETMHLGCRCLDSCLGHMEALLVGVIVDQGFDKLSSQVVHVILLENAILCHVGFQSLPDRAAERQHH